MTVEQFRDLIGLISTVAGDFHACVNDQEVAAWVKRAEKVRLEAWTSEGLCRRATPVDLEKFKTSRVRLQKAYELALSSMEVGSFFDSVKGTA